MLFNRTLKRNYACWAGKAIIFGLFLFIAFSSIGGTSLVQAETVGSTECSGVASCVAGIVYWFTVGIGSGVAYLSAWVFSLATALSLSSTAYALAFLTTGWTLLRDLANMFFVLILVYIALTIMFRADTHNTAKKLAWVILIALVINFSFFFTRVVIDAGNLLAVQFYNAIEAGPIGSSGDLGLPGSEVLTWTGAGTQTKDLTAAIMNGIGVQTILGDDAFNAFQTNSTGIEIFLTLSFIYITVGAMLFMLAAAFFTVGIKFIIRIVVLWLLIIASPLAFVANTLQEGKKYYTQWQSALITHAFYPAFFLVIFYILTLFMNDLTGGDPIKNNILAQSFRGDNIYATGDQYTYIISVMAQVLIRMSFVLALLYIGLQASEKMGVMGAKLAQNATSRAGSALRWGAGMGLRGTAATGGFVGRNTLGRQAYADVASGRVAGWEARGGLWNNLRARGTRGLAKATFDVRNAPGTGKLKTGLSVLDRAMGAVGGSPGYSKITAGKGSSMNFEKMVKAKADNIEARAKEMKATEEEIRRAQEVFVSDYDFKNGIGSYAAKTSELTNFINQKRAEEQEMLRKAAIISDPTVSAQMRVDAEAAKKEREKKQKELEALTGAGKKAADEKARQRIIDFAKRVSARGVIQGPEFSALQGPSHGALQGANRAMKLVTEKSAKDQLAEAAKKLLKEEGGDDGGPDKPSGGGGKKPGSSDSKTDASGSDKTGGGSGDGHKAQEEKIVTTLENVGTELKHTITRAGEKAERSSKMTEGQLHSIAEALRARTHLDNTKTASINQNLAATNAHLADQQPAAAPAPRAVPVPQKPGVVGKTEPGINDFSNFRRAQTESKGVSTPPPAKPEPASPTQHTDNGDSIPRTGTHG